MQLPIHKFSAEYFHHQYQYNTDNQDRPPDVDTNINQYVEFLFWLFGFGKIFPPTRSLPCMAACFLIQRIHQVPSIVWIFGELWRSCFSFSGTPCPLGRAASGYYVWYYVLYLFLARSYHRVPSAQRAHY